MAVIRGRIISGNPGMTTVAAHPPPGNPGTRPRSTIVEQGGHSYLDNFLGDTTANDSLIARDRHVFLDTGTERSGRSTGIDHDPVDDGPIRPSLRSVNRTINFQQGNAPRNVDDLTRAYSKTADGRWMGQQDGSVQPVYGGTPGVWIPYGSYAGFTTGPVQGIQSPVEFGSPQDRPQKVRSGPPHGLHTATFPDGASPRDRYMSIPQMVAPSTSRPLNSRIAGQSYSQTIAPLGQTGTVGIRTIPAGTGARSVGIRAGSSWRGGGAG